MSPRCVRRPLTHARAVLFALAPFASFVLPAATLAGQAPPLPVRACEDNSVCAPTLGVAIAVPAGWHVAPNGQFTPGSLTFVGSLKTMDLRLSIQPFGIAPARSAKAAARAGADALTQGMTVGVRRRDTTVGGAPAVELIGMPGPSTTLQFVVAHAGALYNIVTFGSPTLTPAQRYALDSLRFIPRTGAFPPPQTPSPYVSALADPCLTRGLGRPVPNSFAPPALTLRYRIEPSRGNEMVVLHTAAARLRPGERVTVATCWSRTVRPTYTWYQDTAPIAATASGSITLESAIYVPSGQFNAWTLRVVLVDARTGGRLAAVSLPQRHGGAVGAEGALREKSSR